MIQQAASCIQLDYRPFQSVTEKNTLLHHFVPSNNAKRETYLQSAECYRRKFWVIRGWRDQKMTSLKRKLLMLAHSSQ